MMGVIFDFNGTLFFDGEQQERAWRLFAREAFGKEISDGEFRECVHGRNNDFTMQHLAGKALSARQVDEYVEEKETIDHPRPVRTQGPAPSRNLFQWRPPARR